MGKFLDDVTWQMAVKNAKHYLALGQSEVYLSVGPFPWHLAQSCEPGGTHRLEISTSVWFRGKHESGLQFRWSFDIEDRSADGKGYYQIQTAKIAEAMKQMPPKCARQFSAYLSECANAVQKKGEEWQGYADSQFTTARELRKAAVM